MVVFRIIHQMIKVSSYVYWVANFHFSFCGCNNTKFKGEKNLGIKKGFKIHLSMNSKSLYLN